MRVLLIVDHEHVKRVIEARLEREGFLHDTPTRRRLIEMRAGPPPTPGQGVTVISREEHEERVAA